MATQITPRELGENTARALYAALIEEAPRRVALMTSPRPGATDADKYRDAPKAHAFTADDISDHLAGLRTYAVTLGTKAGAARAGCRDYDAGGGAVVVEALAAAEARGIVAIGIIVEGEGAQHSGGHVWAFYRKPAPVADIRAQLAGLPGERGEIYPSGNCIRLPFGLHRWKGTRGTLVLQDGRRFDLDDPAQLAGGVDAVLSLPRNAAPPEAPPEARQVAGGAFGEHHNPALWMNLPDGAALMASPRYGKLFANNRQLAMLKGGIAVTLNTKAGPDSSGSTQVAVLVNNLIRAHRKGCAPGEGAPPEDEIRAVALYWHKALRPNRSIEHYKADVDGRINEYRPATYAPEATNYFKGKKADAPKPLEGVQSSEKRKRGRPASKRATRADELFDLIYSLNSDDDGARRITRDVLARTMGVTPQMVTNYLADLRGAGRIETRTEGRALAVTSLIIKSGNPPCEPNNKTPVLPIAERSAESAQEEYTPAPPCEPARESGDPHTSARGVIPLPYSAGEVDAARAWLAERPTLIATYLARGAVANPGYWACRVEDGYNHAALSAALAELAPVAVEVAAPVVEVVTAEVVEDAGAAPPEAPAPMVLREFVSLALESAPLPPGRHYAPALEAFSTQVCAVRPDATGAAVRWLVEDLRRERDASIFTAIREEAASATPGELRKRHGAAVTTLRDLEHKAQAGSARRTGTRKGEAYTEEERSTAKQRLGLARVRADILAGELERRGLANQEPPAPKASKARAPLAWFGMPEQYATAAD